MIGDKLEIDDIYVGMKIKDKEQLSMIYDTWILLTKDERTGMCNIEFIGKNTNSESDKLFGQGKPICPVYNDSIELEEDMYFDE